MILFWGAGREWEPASVQGQQRSHGHTQLQRERTGRGALPSRLHGDFQVPSLDWIQARDRDRIFEGASDQ